MGRPSKFTAPVRAKVLEALGYGSSRTTAAAYAGIDDATLGRWLKRGHDEKDGPWRTFADAVRQAEAAPKLKALRVITSEFESRPELAWRFVERREPGFAPPQPQRVEQPMGPVIIQLAFADGSAPSLPGEPTTVIEVQAVEPDSAGTSA